jgi:hypothetical protein
MFYAGLLPALTGDDRTIWARFRKVHLSSGMNRAALEAVERAVCSSDTSITLEDENRFIACYCHKYFVKDHYG